AGTAAASLAGTGGTRLAHAQPAAGALVARAAQPARVVQVVRRLDRIDPLTLVRICGYRRGRRRTFRDGDGGAHPVSAGLIVVPGGTSSSILSSTSLLNRTSAPASTSVSWSIVRDPMIADVTAGCSSTNACAMWVSDTPASAASLSKSST